MRFLFLLVLAVLYVLHNDVWLWNDGTLMLGLPVGLVYHIGFCLVCSIAFLFFVQKAWPGDLRSMEEHC